MKRGLSRCRDCGSVFVYAGHRCHTDPCATILGNNHIGSDDPRHPGAGQG